MTMLPKKTITCFTVEAERQFRWRLGCTEALLEDISVLKKSQPCSSQLLLLGRPMGPQPANLQYWSVILIHRQQTSP